METAKDIIVTLLSKGSSGIQLSIKNTSPNCYELQANNLMLDGEVEQNNFVVKDKATGIRLSYQDISTKSEPYYVKLESYQSIISEEISLELSYNLEHGKSYEVFYMQLLAYSPCEQSLEMLGKSYFIESNHIDINL